MSYEINPFESNPGWDLVKILYQYYGLKDYVDFLYPFSWPVSSPDI